MQLIFNCKKSRAEYRGRDERSSGGSRHWKKREKCMAGREGMLPCQKVNVQR